MLGIFAELLQARLPELARAFDADEGGRSDLVDTLDSLEHAAGVMEFDQVAETVGGLKEFLAAQPCRSIRQRAARRSTGSRRSPCRPGC